jgi:hypothetical protein
MPLRTIEGHPPRHACPRPHHRASWVARVAFAASFSLGMGMGMGLLGTSGCGGGSTPAGAGGRGTGGRSGGTGGIAGTPGTPGTGGRSATGSGGAGVIGGADAGATGGTSGPADAAVAAGDLGKACSSAADCGGGQICLLPTDKLIFGQGGPAHGYCTLPCAVAADVARCQSAGGSCLDLALAVGDPPQGYCMQNCTFGTAGAGSKCRTRPDVACTSLTADPDGGVAAVSAVCIPTCSQDSECPAGRQCDDFASVCVDVKSAGDPLGAHCDPAAATDTCAGSCLPIGTGGPTVVASFCSRRCVVGNLMGCNWIDRTMPLATGGPHGICALASTEADIGDLGFCTQECATVADCSDKDPGGICNTSTLPAEINSYGFCSWE